MGVFNQYRGRTLLRAIYLIVNVLWMCLPQDVLAHARMMHSSPSAGAVTPPPAKIELWFNELLDGRFNSISVFPAAQVNTPTRLNFTSGEAQVDPKDRTHLFVTLKPLQPGNYYVEWRVLSLDGHSAPGRFEFTVAKPK